MARFSYWIGPSGNFYDGDPNGNEHVDDPPWLAKHADTKLDRDTARLSIQQYNNYRGSHDDVTTFMIRNKWVKIDLYVSGLSWSDTDLDNPNDFVVGNNKSRTQLSIISKRPTDRILHQLQDFLIEKHVNMGEYHWYDDANYVARGSLGDFVLADHISDLQKNSKKNRWDEEDAMRNKKIDELISKVMEADIEPDDPDNIPPEEEEDEFSDGDFIDTLKNILYNVDWEDKGFPVKHSSVRTYRDAGMLTMNMGLVIEMRLNSGARKKFDLSLMGSLEPRIRPVI